MTENFNIQFYEKPIYLNIQFIKFIWILLLISGFSGAAMTTTFTVTKQITCRFQLERRAVSIRHLTARILLLRRRIFTEVVKKFDLTEVLPKLFPFPKLYTI